MGEALRLGERVDRQSLGVEPRPHAQMRGESEGEARARDSSGLFHCDHHATVRFQVKSSTIGGGSSGALAEQCSAAEALEVAQALVAPSPGVGGLDLEPGEDLAVALLVDLALEEPPRRLLGACL